MHAPPSVPRSEWALAAALALAGAALLYVRGLHGGYFGDDLNFIYPDPAERTFLRLFAEDASMFFRPLETRYLAAVQSSFGLATWPIHLAGVAAHAVVATLAYAAARLLGLPRGAAGVAGGYALVSQLAVYGVLGNDTLSQVWGTAFTLLSVGLLASALFLPRAHLPSWYGLSLVAFIAALLFKETSAAALPMAVLLIGAAGVWGPKPGRWSGSVALAAPYVLLFGLYLVLRAHVAIQQPEFQNDGYGIHLGPNVLRNLAQFGMALLVPASSVSVFRGFQAGEWLYVGAAVAAAAAVGCLLLLAFTKPNGVKRAAAVFVLGGTALFPAALLAHVSELYAYNALAFVAVLVAMGTWALWERFPARAARGALAAALLLGGASHVLGVQQKVALMVRNGDAVPRLLREVAPVVAAAPEGALVVLRNTPAKRARYSVFDLEEFDPLYTGGFYVAAYAERPDVRVMVLDADSPLPGGDRPVVEASYPDTVARP